MGIFYKPSSYRKMRRFLKKKGFILRQGGNHLIATSPKDEEIEISVPRHTTISNGLTEEICKKLVELGYTEQEIKKSVLK